MSRKRRNESDKLIPIEKSQRIIHLERRGMEPSKHSIGSCIFGILGITCILYCGGIAIYGFGSYFFLIWGGLGAASLLLSAILGNKKLMAAIPKGVKILFGGIFALGLIVFCTVEGLILTQFNAKASSGADFCIILGAQWKENGPSEVLRRRLDTAIAYLQANPGTKVIVSGGQGNNEKISEAAGMQSYLLQAGIAEDRILMEDLSSNTYENLLFSSKFLDSREEQVVIVTNNFHVFRALGIAKKQGYSNVEGLAASSVTGMLPNNLLREFLGVVKDFVLGNL